MEKLFLKIILGVLVVVLAGGVGYLILTRQKIQREAVDFEKIEAKNYSTQPFMECVKCEKPDTTTGWENKPCCADNFEEECSARGGVIRWSDLHPASTILKGCFQKAPDSGKACSSAKDCLSGVCVLQNAIDSGNCKLTKREYRDAYGNKTTVQTSYFTEQYSCNSVNPGICAETIENRSNPGGYSGSLEMEGKTLIKTQNPGPIF